MSKPKKMPPEYAGRDLAALLAAVARGTSEHGTEVLIIDARFADAIEVALNTLRAEGYAAGSAAESAHTIAARASERTQRERAETAERAAMELRAATKTCLDAWEAFAAWGVSRDARGPTHDALVASLDALRALGPAPRAEERQDIELRAAVAELRAAEEAAIVASGRATDAANLRVCNARTRVDALLAAPCAEAPQPAPSQPGDDEGDEEACSRCGALYRVVGGVWQSVDAGPAPQPAPSEAVAMAIAEDVVLAGLEQMHSPPSKEDLLAIVRRHLAASGASDEAVRVRARVRSVDRSSAYEGAAIESGEATAERERALVRAAWLRGHHDVDSRGDDVSDEQCDAIREAVRS